MGAPYRGNNKQDNRRPNVQPNSMPAELSLAVSVDGEQLGTLGIPQAEKLSAAGNVTYNGGFRKGWELEGDPRATLAAISFEVNGTPLKASQHGVHDSENGNPTVCHTGTVELSVGGGETRRYMVQVYPTFSVKKGAYSLSVKAFPAPALRAGGPAIAKGTRVEGSFQIAA